MDTYALLLAATLQAGTVLALAAFGAWMTRRPAPASQPLAQGPSHA